MTYSRTHIKCIHSVSSWRWLTKITLWDWSTLGSTSQTNNTLPIVSQGRSIIVSSYSHIMALRIYLLLQRFMSIVQLCVMSLWLYLHVLICLEYRAYLNWFLHNSLIKRWQLVNTLGDPMILQRWFAIHGLPGSNLLKSHHILLIACLF